MLSTPDYVGAPDIPFKFQRLSQIASGSYPRVFALRLGRSLELTAEGDLIVRMYVDVGNPEVMGHAYLWHSEEYRSTVGSVQVDLMLQQAVGETGQKLKEGLEVFVENLPGRG